MWSFGTLSPEILRWKLKLAKSIAQHNHIELYNLLLMVVITLLSHRLIDFLKRKKYESENLMTRKSC